MSLLPFLSATCGRRFARIAPWSRILLGAALAASPFLARATDAPLSLEDACASPKKRPRRPLPTSRRPSNRPRWPSSPPAPCAMPVSRTCRSMPAMPSALRGPEFGRSISLDFPSHSPATPV